uniref:Major facilitator superfamily (MFS) profile domain-containing protein n=1 Tax=Alexandrium catenella TaxID=2925 RepID=A0A7S1WV92_ALECA
MSLSCVRSSRNLLIPMEGHAVALREDDIGYLMSLSYVVDGLLFPLAGWLLDNVGRNRTGALGLVSYVAALLCLEGQSAAALTAFALVCGWANGITSGIVMTIASDLAPPDARGSFIGLYRTLTRLAELAAPLMVGFLAERCSLRAAALANAAVAGFGCLWVSCCMQRVTAASAA